MPATTRRFLVAGMPPQAEGRADVAALYPDEVSPGVAFSWERIYALSGISHELFREFVAAAAPFLSQRLGLGPAAAAVFAREALVPLSHFYLNRFLRLEALLAADPGPWVVAAPTPLAHPARVERFMNLAVSSPLFNQLMLARLAPLFGLEQAESGLSIRELEREHESAKGFVNRNFATFTAAQKLARVARIAARRLANRRGRIPTLSMSYASDAVKDAGFYDSYLADLRGTAALSDGEPDPALRRDLRGPLTKAGAPVAAFLRAAGSTAVAAEKVFAGLLDYLVEAYPSSLLESAKPNHDAAVEALRPYRRRPLLFSERGDLESAVMIAAAKTLGMTVIGAQHGGHGGFMADLAVAAEVEHAHCDGYITWGWTRFSAYPSPPPQPVTAYDLPSPFLSERARKWRRELDHATGGREYDALLLSNGVHRFSTAPGCAGQSNIDFIHPYCELLVELAREAGRRKVSLLHKPRDPRAAQMLGRTFAAMAQAGGPTYRCEEKLDKGMTKDLLDRCRVVLWDQPGMGFQECLAAGIPTMTYWTRLYNREDPLAAQDVAALEAAGVVHRSMDSLFTEIERVREKGGRAWLAEPARAAAVARFVRLYCRAEDGWARRWIEFFDGLPA